MNKKIIVLAAVAVVIGVFVAVSIEPPSDRPNVVFHITLADPELYKNGVYFEQFVLDEGSYSFRFVPNGSSPEILNISITGNGFNFEQVFTLKNTLHQTDISEYYTWRYDGLDSFSISESKQVNIVINPNKSILGSVTVDILKA